MNKLKFIIIGCGRIGGRHAAQIVKYGELVAVCDVVKERADSLGKEYNVNIYYDIDEMLNGEKSIDVVSVCTPNGMHADHSIKALKHGFHVLCEKPMSINVHDCGRMILEAERANRRLFIVKQNRFNPPVHVVKELIDKGTLGKIFSVQLSCFWNRNKEYYNESDWKGTLNLDGGTLFTQFSHFIDLLYYMIGDIKEVHAFTNNYNHNKEIEFEDTGVVALRFYNGAIGTINYTVNSYKRNMEGSLTIFAEKGTVKIGGQYLNELEYHNIEGVDIKDLPKGNPPNKYGKYEGSMSNHDQVYKNVVEVLIDGGVIATNGFEGLKTVEIIDKIYTNANQ
ncbi:MAG TPA: Gfo/Idh/MocA family oxidoreductase [Ignavibacteriaceae bacterium]|nr:Gfo/Idh/MocA family oxidoreductase [Ignavibacteriaceae bacterium]